MNALSDSQVEFLRKSIRNGGIEMTLLEDDLLDHICCSIETKLAAGNSFEKAYLEVLTTVCPDGFREIQEETTRLLTLKFEAMKKSVNLIGTIGSSLLFIGGLLRFLYLPGANITLCLGGILIAFVFLPFSLVYWLKQTDQTLSKIKYVAGYISGTFLIVGVIFKLMHFTGANVILFSSIIIFLLVFLPLFLKTSTKESLNSIPPVNLAVILLVVASLFFSFNTQRKEIDAMNLFSLPDKSINNMTKKIENKNSTMYKIAVSDSILREDAKTIKILSDDIYYHISNLKNKIYLEYHKNPSKNENSELTVEDFYPGDGYKTTTELLIGNDPLKPKSDNYSAIELKQKIEAYKNQLSALLNKIDENQLKPSIGLSTENTNSNGIESSWEVSNFYHTPVVAVITTLDLIQNELRYTEQMAYYQLILNK